MLDGFNETLTKHETPQSSELNDWLKFVFSYLVWSYRATKAIHALLPKVNLDIRCGFELHVPNIFTQKLLMNFYEIISGYFRHKSDFLLRLLLIKKLINFINWCANISWPRENIYIWVVSNFSRNLRNRSRIIVCARFCGKPLIEILY